jgi:hypothetical protein
MLSKLQVSVNYFTQGSYPKIYFENFPINIPYPHPMVIQIESADITLP